MGLATNGDREAEQSVANAYAAHYGFTMHKYAELDPIDYWIEHAGRCIGFAEIKCFTIPVNQRPAVVLNMRKWQCLLTNALNTGLPNVLIVRWAGANIGHIDVRDIDATRHRIIARSPRANGAHGAHDREPVILVPVTRFRMLKGP